MSVGCAFPAFKAFEGKKDQEKRKTTEKRKFFFSPSNPSLLRTGGGETMTSSLARLSFSLSCLIGKLLQQQHAALVDQLYGHWINLPEVEHEIVKLPQSLPSCYERRTR